MNSSTRMEGSESGWVRERASRATKGAATLAAGSAYEAVGDRGHGPGGGVRSFRQVAASSVFPVDS
jgi:hypothetical protein